MAFKTHQTPPNCVLLPKTQTFKQAARYSGLSEGTLRSYAKARLVIVYNMIIPGKSRGIKLIDRLSLDLLIESSIGNVTTSQICPCKEGNEQ